MIYVVWGLPRGGKSYFLTRKALKFMRDGKTVFSNYPIMAENGETTFVWSSDLVYKNIHDAVIIIDEAYQEVSSRDYRSFTKDQHTFYATNGHNGLDIYLIAQNPARLDKVIREMTNQFYCVRPFCIWGCEHPIFFTVYGYLSEIDMSQVSGRSCWSCESYFFSWKIARAYDTHFYRCGKSDYQPVRWSDRDDYVFERSGVPGTGTGARVASAGRQLMQVIRKKLNIN